MECIIQLTSLNLDPQITLQYSILKQNQPNEVVKFLDNNHHDWFHKCIGSDNLEAFEYYVRAEPNLLESNSNIPDLHDSLNMWNITMGKFQTTHTLYRKDLPYANFNYNVAVRVRSTNKNSTEWSPTLYRNFTTLPAIPPRPPTVIRGNYFVIPTGNKQNLRVYWQQLNRTDHFGSNFETVISRYSKNGLPGNVSEIEMHKNWAVIRNWDMSANHTIALRSKNQVGSSINESHFNIPAITLADLEQRVVQNIDFDETITLTWKPPKYETGLRGYTIFWCHVNPKNLSDCKDDEPIRFENITSRRSSFVVKRQEGAINIAISAIYEDNLSGGMIWHLHKSTAEGIGLRNVQVHTFLTSHQKYSILAAFPIFVFIIFIVTKINTERIAKATLPEGIRDMLRRESQEQRTDDSLSKIDSEQGERNENQNLLEHRNGNDINSDTCCSTIPDCYEMDSPAPANNQTQMEYIHENDSRLTTSCFTDPYLMMSANSQMDTPASANNGYTKPEIMGNKLHMFRDSSIPENVAMMVSTGYISPKAAAAFHKTGYLPTGNSQQYCDDPRDGNRLSLLSILMTPRT
ncbi:uncharacterized protein LOC115627362 [Scaptodrosophila lebanonensis]|uniref:Uncharacterized protein LOC115627362 n=1 Tax=Drosophila lebanonensis TaxID=7225 RepID=A0A6J2TVE7_DROLE|nr:uncharacterized protein LOC115627362 [Scaptodrosophila lebanonensis]